MQHATYPSLANKRVVITGGGTGIGVAIVEAFARQGAHVTFLDIAREASLALQEKLAHLPQPPVFRYCDLTDLAALAATFADIEHSAGATDILVNNAANDDRHQLQDVTPAYWDERIAVNLRHQYFCAQAVAPAMRAKGSGVILNLGSISWHLAQANLSIYMTAKAGIEGLTRGLARDLGADGIRVNGVRPGIIYTDIHASGGEPGRVARLASGVPMRRGGQPEEVAQAIAWLLSDKASYVTGSFLELAGGK